MLRITSIESGNHKVVLRLEGRVSGPWVSELGEACEKALSVDSALLLNLAEVSFLDNAGLHLLTRLQKRGVELVDCSMFVAEQLKSLRLGTKLTRRVRQPLVSE
jgi:anti-anti-sigma regulatory factor